jgi:tRNA nucleotidyltransferase (CCA-adding enzyme)
LPAVRANLGELLDTSLPVALRHIPQRVHDVAEATGTRVALVGGMPRDLLRIRAGQLDAAAWRETQPDFDLVIEGDAIAFAYELVRRLPGKLTLNRDFGTATIATDDPVAIDLAGARTEHYPTPGLLPVVELGATLESDLSRRDFTVNCLAIELSDQYGALLDVVGGSADLKARLIRTLHAASFFDDPTRIFRALRYSARLGYDYEPVTREQFNEGVDGGNVDCLSPERVRHELELVAREPEWANIWQAMHFSGLLHSVHPALLDVYTGWLPSDARALDNAIRSRGDLLAAEELEPWLVRTAWALEGVETAQLSSVGSRIGLFTRHLRWLLQARDVLADASGERVQELPPSLACALLERFARQAVVIATFVFQPRTNDDVDLRKTLLRFIEEWSHVRSELSSDELRRLGLEPGPAFGALRNQLRYLRLDGIIASVEQEREYARQYIAGLASGREQ